MLFQQRKKLQFLPKFWVGPLKYTKIKLDYIKDVNIQLFIKKGIRGGISTIVHRYAKANNKDSVDYDGQWLGNESISTHR